MSEVYQRLIEFAPSFRRRGLWAFLLPRPDVRRWPRDTEPVLVRLRERFSDEELETAGVLVENQELGNHLRVGPCFLVALRTAPNSSPYDVLSPSGSLAGNCAPCLAAARDTCTAQGLQAWGRRLFVAFEMGDLAILRDLGLPVTLATGLDRLDGTGLRSLLGRLPSSEQIGANSCASGSNEQNPIWTSVDKLVFVGWSIRQLTGRVSDGFARVASRFGRASRYFEFDTSRIRAWQPTRLHLERIRLAVQLRDRELVCQAMADSADHALRPMERFVADQPEVPASRSFLRTRQNLIDELRHEQEQRLESIWTPKLVEMYNCAFERAFVEPLVRESVSAKDPIDRATLLTASQLVQELHNSSSLVIGCAEHAQRTRTPWSVPLEPEVLKQRLKVLDRLIAIARVRKE